MSIIEQAARRLDELKRAGVEVPWSAPGLAGDHTAPAQGLPGDGRRTGCAVQAGKLAIEVLGKGEGVAVVNRSVPAQYVGDTGADEFAHEGFAAAGAGVGLLGGAAGRQEDQGQCAGVAQRADKLAHSGQRPGAGFILQG